MAKKGKEKKPKLTYREMLARRRAGIAAYHAKRRGDDPEIARQQVLALEERKIKSETARRKLEIQLAREQESQLAENKSIVRANVIEIATRYASKAIENLVNLAESAKNESVRRLCNLDILNIAGVTVDGKAPDGGGAKPLSELSRSELQAFISAGRATLDRLQSQQTVTIDDAEIVPSSDDDVKQDDADAAKPNNDAGSDE